MSQFTAVQICSLLTVGEGKLRYWQKLGLFPRKQEGYTWSDLQRGKLLDRLTSQGVPATHLLPHTPLLEGHELQAASKTLVLDHPEGPREVNSGQLLFDFREPANESTPQVLYLPRPNEWLKQAHEALGNGDRGRALELAQGALEADLTDVGELNNLGLLFLDLGELTLAIDTLERACHNPHAGARQWFNLSHALESTGDSEAAIDALEQSLRLDPDFSAGRFNLAYTCEVTGQTGRAYKHWKTFLERHPDSEDAEKIRLHLFRFYDDGRVIPLRSSI